MYHKKRYSYNAFGLNIVSDIELLGLIKGNDYNQLEIIKGTVHNKIRQNEIEKNLVFKYNSNECWMYIKNIGHFYVKNGEKIIVEPEVNVRLDLLRTYLLSNALSMILLQRKLIALHGSAVVIDDKAFVFTGNSGAGKSTVCNLLIKNGLKFLTDDISVIINNNDINYVHPSFPFQRLCNDTIKHLKIDTNSSYSDNDKCIIDMSEFFINRPIPLVGIIELVFCSKSNVNTSLKEIKGVQKLKSFLNNLYYCQFQKVLGIDNKLFSNITKNILSIPYYKFERPNNGFILKEQNKLIIELILQLANGF